MILNVKEWEERKHGNVGLYLTLLTEEESMVANHTVLEGVKQDEHIMFQCSWFTKVIN